MSGHQQPPPYSVTHPSPADLWGDLPWEAGQPHAARSESEPLLNRPQPLVSRTRMSLLFIGLFVLPLVVLPLVVLLPLDAVMLTRFNNTRFVLSNATTQLGVVRTQLASLRYEREQEASDWADERRRREEQRWRDDANKRDADERARMRLFWDTPRRSEHCARYGAREYQARLWNVAEGYDWIQACNRTPIAINNNVIATPDWCEIRDGVWGHWTVPFMEPDCVAHWSDFLDKNCIGRGSGLRQFEARLDGVHWGENAYHPCTTAPATIRGVHFDQPKHCFEHDRGMWAAWEVPDATYC